MYSYYTGQLCFAARAGRIPDLYDNKGNVACKKGLEDKEIHEIPLASKYHSICTMLGSAAHPYYLLVMYLCHTVLYIQTDKQTR